MENLKRFMMVFLLALCFCFSISYVSIADNTGPQFFYTELVDDGGDSGWNYKDVGSVSCLAIGPDNSIHIAYYDFSEQKVKYARKINGEWRTETIDEDVKGDWDTPKRLSIACDANGNPHVSYFSWTVNGDINNAEVKYAVKTENNWTIEPVDHIYTGSEKQTHIDFTKNGDVKLLYGANWLRSLYFAHKDNGVWEIKEVPNSSANNLWSATMVNDQFYIAQSENYYKDLHIHIGLNESWVFNEFRVGLLDAENPSISTDSSGNLNIVTHAGVEGLRHFQINPDLTVQENVLSDVDYAGYRNDMIMDDQDNIHIVYNSYDFWKNKVLNLRYMYVERGGLTSAYQIEDGEYEVSSMAMDSIGNFHVSYYDTIRGNLKYLMVQFSEESLSVSESTLDLIEGEIQTVTIRGGKRPYTIDYRNQSVLSASLDTASLTVTGVRQGSSEIIINDSNKDSVTLQVNVESAFAELVPEPAILTSPSGQEQAVEISPVFMWNGELKATWYKLFIWDSSEKNIFAKWYDASDICSGGNCSVKSESALQAGSYKWFVKSWNDYGSTWSDGITFSIQGDDTPPSKVRQASPLGNTTGSNPTFIWDADPASTWYRLWVGYADDIKVFAKWYEASEICLGGECSVTPELNLLLDDYEWYIKSWNEYGKVWSDGMSFEVE